jgi:hypothetical protein
VLLSLLVAAAAATAPASGTYTGTTTEHLPVKIVVRGGHVVRASARTGTYTCDPHGELGGNRITVDTDADATGGTFRFDAGREVLSLKMTGTVVTRTRIKGRLRIHGTIGTGDPCTSRAVRFTVRRR